MTNDQVLYLLSSTAEPYIKDILDILALPSGFNYRFRYQFRWLTSEFQLQEQLDRLKNREVLIVHIVTEPIEGEVGKRYRILEYIPIRKAFIIETKIMAGFVNFEFKLGDYVKFDKPFDKIKETKNPFSDQIKSKIPLEFREYVKNLAVLAPQINVQWLSDTITKPNDEVVVSWFNLVSYIGRLKPYKELGAVFTKLLEITNVNTNKTIVSEEIAEELHGFRLNSANAYRIRILQRYLNAEKVDPIFKLEITCNSKDINTIKNQALIQGGYDVLDFIISVPDVVSSRETFLYIKPDETGSRSFMVSSIIYFVKITPNIRKLCVVFGVVTSGIILAALSNNIAYVTHIPQLSTVLSVIGAIISAVSAPFFPKS
jgi:hypothetical protein